MFDLSKWENDHPAVRRFAQQLVDVLENVAEHLIGQASAAVSDALAGTPTADTRATSDNTLSAPQSVSGVPEDAAPVAEPQASAQAADEATPADSTPGALAAARALVDEGYTPAHAAAIAGVDVAELEPAAPHGPGAGGVGDSGPAGVTLPPPDEPAAAAPAGVPGADMPVTHNVEDPAAIVGSGTVSG